MIASELNPKHLLEPSTSCTYKTLKRDAGNHNISESDRSQGTASESLTTLVSGSEYDSEDNLNHRGV